MVFKILNTLTTTDTALRNQKHRVGYKMYWLFHTQNAATTE